VIWLLLLIRAKNALEWPPSTKVDDETMAFKLLRIKDLARVRTVRTRSKQATYEARYRAKRSSRRHDLLARWSQWVGETLQLI